MEGKGYTPGDGRPPAIWHAQNGWGLPGTPLSALDVTPMSSRENVVFPCLSDHRVWSAGGRWRGTSVRWAGGPAPLACPCSAPLIGSSPGSWSWPKVVTWGENISPERNLAPGWVTESPRPTGLGDLGHFPPHLPLQWNRGSDKFPLKPPSSTGPFEIPCLLVTVTRKIREQSSVLGFCYDSSGLWNLKIEMSRPSPPPPQAPGRVSSPITRWTERPRYPCFFLEPHFQEDSGLNIESELENLVTWDKLLIAESSKVRKKMFER